MKNVSKENTNYKQRERESTILETKLFMTKITLIIIISENQIYETFDE